MNRLTALVLAIGALCACDDGRGRAAAVEDRTLHAHPATESPVRTAVGQIRNIDVKAGTLTVVLAQGRSKEHSRRGRAITLQATPAQLAALEVDAVVEFKSRAARPYPTLLAVEAHGHGIALGSSGVALPEGEAGARERSPAAESK